MDILEIYIVVAAYIISNALAALVLWMALRHPVGARFALGILFALAAWINWNTAVKTPDNYLSYAQFAFLPVYSAFINGWFSHHITAFVGAIATGQALIATGFFAGGRFFTAAAWGAIIFLLAILPLGMGAAFPATLILAIAAYVALRRRLLQLH